MSELVGDCSIRQLNASFIIHRSLSLSLSLSGKTTLALEILLNQDEWISPPGFDFYFWALPEGATPPEAVVNGPLPFRIIRGIPDGASLPERALVCIDDLQSEQNTNLVLLFTVHSHHKHISVLNLTHSLFPKNRFQRDLTQSTKYIFAKKSPRDVQAFHRLAVQLEPGGARNLYDAYREATKAPFGHFLVDLTQDIHPALRFRSVHPLPGGGGQATCIYAHDTDVDDLMKTETQYGKYDPSAPHSSTSSLVHGESSATQSSAGHSVEE